MKRSLFVFAVLLALGVVGEVSARAVAGATGALAAPARGESAASTATGTLALRASLPMESIRAGACPPGVSASTFCPARTAVGVAPGLGRVTYSYAYLVDLSHPSCSSGFAKVLGYPVRFTVVGKGEIHFAVSETACLPESAGRSAGQAFTITGGSGMYAGASGSGTVERILGITARGATGAEKWIGTLNVPGLEFDVSPPALSGTTSKTVRVSKRVKRVRVRYEVTATDRVDGPVSASCRPRSGSRFKIGRTVVRCSTTDTSGNTANAAFTIRVRVRR